MADKPSRAVVVYGDGLARTIEPSHTHLHSFASRACCGLLSLPNSPPSETEDGRILREFAELLDASEAYGNPGEEYAEVNAQEKHLISTISEKFMGMKAAIVSDNSHLRSLGSKLGLTTLEFNKLPDNNHSSELLRLLGFQEGKTSDTAQFDLIFVRIGAGETISGLKDIDYANNLVGELIHTTQPGNEISSRLHMSVVMSYGGVSANEDMNIRVSIPNNELKPELSRLLPRQSYTIKGGKPRVNVRQHCPMLMAQCQSGVTRKDMVESYSFEDFEKLGGNLVIPADRFVHEVAFKLWKAPKYGA